MNNKIYEMQMKKFTSIITSICNDAKEKRRLEFEKEEYEELKDLADSYGISWDHTIYDKEGLEQAINDYEELERYEMQRLNWDYYNNLGVN